MLAVALLSCNLIFGQCYEFGITNGIFNPATPIPIDSTVEVIFEVCNEGDALPLDPNGSMGISFCPFASYLSPASDVYGSATDYFTFDSFFGCILGTQSEVLPVDICVEFKILYTSVGTSYQGDFTDDEGELNGFHCITANISPSGIYAGGACHDTTDDYLQICNYSLIVLPVDLTDFTAQKRNKETLLNWKTQSEVNNDRFDIERSIDGLNFTKIGEVKGHGNVNAEISYGFTDKDPALGLNYYRLKQFDYDGRSALSEIRQVSFDASSTRISISPNPASDFIQIQSVESSLSVQVYNTVGKLLLEDDLSADNILSVDALPAGAYVIRVLNETGEVLTTQKIIMSK